VHTFSVIAEAHLGLAKTYCVLALADAIELLKLGLVNALESHNVSAALPPTLCRGAQVGRVSRATYLAGEVDLNGLDADVLGAQRHDVVCAVTVCIEDAVLGGTQGAIVLMVVE